MCSPSVAALYTLNTLRSWHDQIWQACPALAGFSFVEEEILSQSQSSFTGLNLKLHRTVRDTRIKLPKGWRYRHAATLKSRDGRFERIVYQAVPKGGA